MLSMKFFLENTLPLKPEGSFLRGKVESASDVAESIEQAEFFTTVRAIHKGSTDGLMKLKPSPRSEF